MEGGLGHLRRFRLEGAVLIWQLFSGHMHFTGPESEAQMTQGCDTSFGQPA